MLSSSVACMLLSLSAFFCSCWTSTCGSATRARSDASDAASASEVEAMRRGEGAPTRWRVCRGVGNIFPF